jgi:hypothetical protein
MDMVYLYLLNVVNPNTGGGKQDTYFNDLHLSY